MASVNKVIVLGNVGREPEIRYTPSNVAVVNLSIATSRKSKRDGESQEETEWHNVVFFDKLAEIVGEYVTKGRSIYVEGRLRTRKWQDKSGQDRYTTEIVAEQMQMLGGKDAGERHERPSAATAPAAPAARSPAPQTSTGFDEMDDDIPFVSADFAHDIAIPIARRMRRYRF